MARHRWYVLIESEEGWVSGPYDLNGATDVADQCRNLGAPSLVVNTAGWAVPATKETD